MVTASTSLIDAARSVLLEPDPFEKQKLTDEIARIWREGRMEVGEDVRDSPLVDTPARSGLVQTLEPSKMPKMGKGGSLSSRQMILHSLTHIESVAVDLAWDAIARFGSNGTGYQLPREFFDDFVAVAEDEARHFRLLAERLKAMGSYYGAFPTHEGLWRSAAVTSCSLPARLAVEHCVHEARGLDVLPGTIRKLRNGGDEQSAAVLESVIYPEEVSHCAAGVRWLKHLHTVAHSERRTADKVQLKHSPQAVCSQATAENADKEPNSSPDQLASELHSCRVSAVCVEYGHERPVSSGTDCAAEHSSTSSHLPCVHHQENKDIVNGMQVNKPTGEVGCEGINQSDHGDIQQERSVGWQASAREFATVQKWFHWLVRSYFKGNTKPPFNDEAREKAGFSSEWYEPLVTDEGRSSRPE